jgi:hypothetical protein
MNQVICEECDTVSHCMKNGCVPKVKVAFEKPVVYYLGEPIFWNYNDKSSQPVARFAHVLNHPKLGACEIYHTSIIIAKLDDGTIETYNTIYKPLTLELNK